MSENTTLIITETTNPLVSGYNDKLSAHKVFASTLSLFLPQNLSLRVKAKSASMEVNGGFYEVSLFLEEGKLILNSPYMKGTVTTRSADVEWHGLQQNFSAMSKFGDVIGAPVSQKDSPFISVLSVLSGHFAGQSFGCLQTAYAECLRRFPFA